MKFFISLLIFSSSSFCLSQSKKDQILELNNRIDSLNLILETERDTNTQKLSSLNSKISELSNQISIDQKNLELKEKEILNYQKTNIELTNQIAELSELIKIKSDSLELLISKKRRNYLDVLPNGLTLTDANDKLGERCSSDFDGDGIDDLIIMLFNEDGDGCLLIFSSKNFYNTGIYQYFDWIYTGNLLGDFNCEKGLKISGGFEANDESYFEELHLNWDPNREKMVVNSFLNSQGNRTFDRLKEATIN
jgi:hypothetical protein